ncbi:MAG: hypothetical protein JXR76_24105 [Deltaproteobacteria bacterium]|nr:hypothetical protein [Deltaproteobacteria bacterium]
MIKKHKYTLAEVAGIGSVEQNGHGAVTLSFLNVSIRMCKHRFYVLAGMIGEASRALARNDNTHVDIPVGVFSPKVKKHTLN